MSVSGPVVEATGLRVDYGPLHVLAGLNLWVERGDVVALLGPNGAGKTTTIEILEGYRVPTAGSVRVLGFDPASHATQLRARTGVVLQECGFPSHLRVEELLDCWRGYYPTPRPVDELLDVVELRTERRTLIRRLSGGQRRRLDFALALAGDPELMFLDEPTTGFDPEARHRCWTAIENLQALGKTILLTTHYLDEAEHLADQVAILIDGRIRANGTVSELAQVANAPTRISFTSTSGEPIVIRTKSTTRTLRDLFNTYVELPDLAVAPPKLEDVYLELVAE